MELSLSAMAKKLIEDRILGEVRNLLKQKASTAFLAAVLPAAPQADAGSSIRIKAALKLSVQSLEIESTIHAGGSSERKNLLLENEEQDFSIDTGFRLRKPKDLADSETLDLKLDKLELVGALGGIEFSKMMLGAGATVHGIKIKAVLSGSGTGVWQTGSEALQESVRS